MTLKSIFREFIDKLKEEFEKFKPEKWSGDPIDVPGATLVLEIVEVKDDRKARYYYHFRRLFIENFKDYYEELKTKDGEIKFLKKNLKRQKGLLTTNSLRS